MRYDPSKCYVGPESWPQFILRLSPFWRLFNYAAYLHDKFFRRGGTIEDFHRANRIFRTMCHAVAKTRWQKFGAETHALLCENFGLPFFRLRETCVILRKR